MYQIGEFIVKAANGVCEVKDLVHLDFSDTDSKKLYYLLVPVTDQAGKIYMPATGSATVRKVMTKQEAMAFIRMSVILNWQRICCMRNWKWHWIKTKRKSTGLFRSSVGNPII